MLPSLFKKKDAQLYSSLYNLFNTFFSDYSSKENEPRVFLKPRTDIHETEKDITLDVELPGLNKKDITVSIKDDIITVSGERNHKQETNTNNFSRVERHYGKFQRSFWLPDMVNSESISAKYSNGLLTLTLPKIEKAIPKEIPISVN